MVYRSKAGRLGAGFISESLETRCLGPFGCFLSRDDSVRCIALQHAATHCNTLQNTDIQQHLLKGSSQKVKGTDIQHTATFQHTVTYCNILHYTASHCITLHHFKRHGM